MSARTGAALIVAALMVAACTMEPIGVPREIVNAAGRYGLTTVNDSLLPRTIQVRTNYTLEITSDTIVLNADGSWADGTFYREREGDLVTSFSNFIGGSFKVASDGTVTFYLNNKEFTGTLNGSTLTIQGGSRAVYRK